MRKILFLISLISIGCLNISAQIDTKELEKWEGRKYSMFIHWGIYSDLGGMWQGKRISYGLSEQIQAHAGIYSDTYAEVAEKFNPENWNAEKVVLLAKKAGMKSIVMTSKHHDGFCMYATETTQFNIVDATPYGKDVLKELSDACAKHDIKFGLYYSLIDWHFPQAMPISSHNSDNITPEHFEYNKAQVKELLTNYGEISELWFDMGSHSFEQSVEMKEWVRKFQPNCMVGGRIGNSMGDFMVMGDNQEPSYIIGVPWQSPASFFPETWGYRSWQNRVPKDKKLKEKLTSLINVCARGGNYLLNIGPRGDGSVVEYESDILLEMGKWLDKNGEAIYNSKPDPFHKAFYWGAVTAKDDAIYLHITHMPSDREIFLSGLDGDIRRVEILGQRSRLKYNRTREGVSINIPRNVNADAINVVKVSFKKGFEVKPLNIYELCASLELNQYNAFNYYSHSGVDYNSSYQSTIKNAWTILPQSNNKLKPVIRYTKQELGRIIELELGRDTIELILDVDEDTKVVDSLTTEGVKFGSIYTQPMRRGSLMRIHGDIKNIDLNKKWADEVWTKSDYVNNESYSLSGGLLRAYYIVQEIESEEEKTILISVKSGDGIVAALNGETILNHGNLKKDKSMVDIIALNLKKGKNQLFVKLFSNYQDRFEFSINTDIEQKYFEKELKSVRFKSDEYFPVSWRVKNSIAVHETMNMPNMSLRFE